jgi:hypothetical protein
LFSIKFKSQRKHNIITIKAIDVRHQTPHNLISLLLTNTTLLSPSPSAAGQTRFSSLTTNSR